MKKITLIQYTLLGYSILTGIESALASSPSVRENSTLPKNSPQNEAANRVMDKNEAVLVAFSAGQSLPGAATLENEIGVILSRLEGNDTEGKEALNKIKSEFATGKIKSDEALEDLLKRIRALYSQRQFKLINVASIHQYQKE